MPKINVYLSDELAEAVRAAGIPVSPVCQQALQLAVRKVAAIRETTAKMDLDTDDVADRFQNFTAKANQAVTNALRLARSKGQDVGTEHLLAALVDGGDNMAVQALLALELDPDDLRAELLATMPADASSTETERRFEPTGTAALQAALAEAISMGHNYIGCEHLLLGIVSEPDGTGGAVLREHGIDLKAARRTVQASLGGYVYARNRAEGQQPAGAEQLRQVLTQFGQRLDRIEARLARLPDDS
jgi:ATP-dependent Clp protease ATP-binding subunit ClpC